MNDEEGVYTVDYIQGDTVDPDEVWEEEYAAMAMEWTLGIGY